MKKFLSILLCVCLLATTVFTMPMVMAEEAEVEAKEYFYHFNDFESLTNDEEWLSRTKQGTSMSVENGENVIGGSQSLKTTANGVGYSGFALSNVGVGKNIKTRVSFDYKVTVGTKDWSGVGYIGHVKATNSAGEEGVDCYNASNVINKSFADNVTAGISNPYAASATVRNFKGTITRNDSGAEQPVGIFMNDKNAPLEVIFDNVKIAEIIETVTAVSDNEAKGTVTVANKESKYTDYAMYETAVFTATPTEGYSFKGWYNGDELVSTDAVYEHTLTGDTTLTAKWKLFEKEYDYKAYDYENMTDCDSWFATARDNTMSFETDNPISGSASLKLTANAKGYIAAAIIPSNVSLKSATNYRMTASTRVTAGVFNYGRIGSATTAGGTVNPWNIGTGAAPLSNGCVPFVLLADNWTKFSNTMAVRTVTSTMTTATSGALILGSIFSVNEVDENSVASILIDNFVAAEIIGTVAAVSADETKGTVAVANKNEKFTDYAKNEIAVFTATPKDGYSFKGWYNAEGELVSTNAVYEHTLTTDTTLTAEWKLYEKEYDYKAYDFENGYFGDSFPYEGVVNTYTKNEPNAITSVVSEETENPVSGASSYKYFFGNGDTNWAFLTPKTAENKLIKGANYRVSGKYVLQQNSVAVVAVNVGAVEALFKLHTAAYAASKLQITNGKNASGYTYDFSGTITTVDAGYPSIYGYTQGDYTSDYILFDDLVYAQIIDSVSATSADSAMGSATVVNKAGYEDYAKNEVAVFTATPNKGYYLEGWYNANGEKVSSDKVYEATLTTDTNLTAKFAAYDKLVNVSFNTNGGNEIDSVTDGEGAEFVLPTPVKEGYTFVGWYTDTDLTNRFTETTIPAEDITLNAKWIIGAYQDFENYTATTNGKFTAMTDGENAYLGNGYIKYTATAKDSGSRLVVSDVALKDFALPGDKIEVSFKYKLVSGDARFYMHTSSRPDAPALTNIKKDDSSANVWLNAYGYKNTVIATTPSEEWQTLTVVYDLCDNDTIANTGKGFTVNEFLYSILFLISDNGAELYIDEMTLNLIPGTHVKTAYNNAAALRSSEASSTGKNGLRIYNEVDTDWVEAKNIVEYGSVAAFASNVNGEITLENGKKGVSYSDGTFSAETSSVWEVKANSVVYTSYLTNIGSARYSEDILIRGYAIAADGTVYYGETVTVSVFNIANAIDNAETADGSEQTEADANAFYTFVTNVNKSAYQAWCDANGKTVGALFTAKY